MRIAAIILAIILIFFGVLFVWGAFSPQGQVGWLIVGGITILLGLGLILITSRKASPSTPDQNVTLKIDLPASSKFENLQCRSCGGSLTMDNIKMVAGAPVVNCPYCHTTYQITEEPKW